MTLAARDSLKRRILQDNFATLDDLCGMIADTCGTTAAAVKTRLDDFAACDYSYEYDFFKSSDAEHALDHFAPIIGRHIDWLDLATAEQRRCLYDALEVGDIHTLDGLAAAISVLSSTTTAEEVLELIQDDYYLGHASPLFDFFERDIETEFDDAADFRAHSELYDFCRRYCRFFYIYDTDDACMGLVHAAYDLAFHGGYAPSLLTIAHIVAHYTAADSIDDVYHDLLSIAIKHQMQ